MVNIKKYFSIIASLILIFALSVTAFAAKAEVYAEKVKAMVGDEVNIPFIISNNPGMMGFKVTVNYPKEFSSPKVVGGEVIAGGMLNDSIVDSTDGSFDIVWTGNENTVLNGTVFTLRFDVSAEMELGEYEIGIKYSQADTFNEKWEDVKLDCKNAVVEVVEKSASVTLQTATVPITKTIQEKKQAFIDDVLMKADSDEVSAAVQDSLKELDVQTIAQLPQEKQKEFVNAVESKLKAVAPDIEGFSSLGMDVQQAVEAIDGLQNSAKEFETQGVNVSEEISKIEQKEKNSKAIKNAGKIILLAVCSAVIITAIAVVIHKRKTGQAKNEEENTDEKQ